MAGFRSGARAVSPYPKKVSRCCRSSVMQFRDPVAHNLREIGRLLGVANVLEGSVRREGDRVVVNVQLVDALKDRHLWANRYERTLADSLGLQGELASEIAEALRVTLSPNEKARIGTKPTENADAYLVYLQANQIERNPDTLLEDYKKAEQLYLTAIGLDPKFARALAGSAPPAGPFFNIMSRLMPGRRRPASKPMLPFSCNRIWPRRISRSVNAFTGSTGITTARFLSSTSFRAYRLTTARRED